MPCQAPCRHSPHLQQCRSHGSIQGWEASAHHQAEPCQGQVLPWDEPGRSWSSSRSLRDGAEPPAGLGISTGSRDGFQSAPSSRHLPHGEGSGAVPAPRGAQKQGISVNVARHLPGSTTPGSRAARLSESSIKDKKLVQIPQTDFSKAPRSQQDPSPKLGLTLDHLQGPAFQSCFPKMALAHRAGSSGAAGTAWACNFFVHIPKPTFSSP